MILGFSIVRGEFVGGTDLHQRISTNLELGPLARKLASFDNVSSKVRGTSERSVECSAVQTAQARNQSDKRWLPLFRPTQVDTSTGTRK